MRRYFVNDLQIAIVESPLTAQAAERYCAANGWRAVDHETLSYVWSCRDGLTLYQRTLAAREKAQMAAFETAPIARAGYWEPAPCPSRLFRTILKTENDSQAAPPRP